MGLGREQLKQLLGDDYDFLMDLWKERDPYFYDVITGDELQSGDYLEASMLGGQIYFLEVDGVMNAYALGGAFSTDLRNWQGQGAYRITKPGMSREEANYSRDQLFEQNETVPNTVITPVFDYNRMVNGRMRPAYLGARQMIQSVNFEYAPIRIVDDSRINFGIRQTPSVFRGIAWKFSFNLLGRASGLVGAAKISADVVNSVSVSYQNPRVYSPMDINPGIPIDYFAH